MSVRALRFYDQTGLLSPSKRTESRYRLYSDADLERLQQILALKFLGFSLEEIKAFLNASPSRFREALTQQKAMLRERRDQIGTIIQAIEQAEQVVLADGNDWDSLVNVIQAIQMDQNNEWRKKYFTEEQLKTMKEIGRQSYSAEAREKLSSRGEWTEEDQRRVDEQYNALYTGVKKAVADGQGPSGAEAQELAGQAIGLLDAFTMNDPEIEAGLANWWKHHAELPADQRPYQSPLSDDESAFLEQAKAIYIQRRHDAGSA